MIRSRRTAAGICKKISAIAFNRFHLHFSTTANPRKLIKAQSSLPQASSAFTYATQNLIGHVRMPGQFQVSDFGKKYWDACAVVRQESDSKSKPRWIPVLFQGETADSVSYHLKETEYAFIPGRVCHPSSTQDQIEKGGHSNPATCDATNKMENHTIIPLLPLKSSIFVHDALAAQLMYLVT